MSDGPGSVQKASYGEKFHRRLPIVLLVVTGLYGVVVLSSFLGDPLSLMGRSATGASAYRAGTVIGAGIGVVLAGLFWTAIAALFPGKHKEKGVRTGIPLLALAIALAVGVGLLFGMQLVRTPAVETPTVTSAAEGCRAFLSTIEDLATSRTGDPKAAATFEALQTAVATTNPEMAADLEPFTSTAITTEQLNGGTESIVVRCIDQGNITESDVQAWGERLRIATS